MTYQGPRERPDLVLVPALLPAAASGEEGASTGCGAEVPVLPCSGASGLSESHQAANLSTTWFTCTWLIWGQMCPPWKFHLLSGFDRSRRPQSSDKLVFERRRRWAEVKNRSTGQRVENGSVGGSTLSDKWLCFLWQSRYKPVLLKVLLTTLSQTSPSLQGIAAFLQNPGSQV